MVETNKLYNTRSIENYKLKRLQNIIDIFQTKIYILNIRSTLNNIYVTLTNNSGQIVLVKSGGTIKVSSSKRNTNYSLELILNMLLKKLVDLNIRNLILKLDFASLRKKKILIKVIQKFSIKVLGVQLNAVKAFNGVRFRKLRRI
jgi:ribosomal protein S11